jgi:hypothetical protein
MAANAIAATAATRRDPGDRRIVVTRGVSLADRTETTLGTKRSENVTAPARSGRDKGMTAITGSDEKQLSYPAA